MPEYSCRVEQITELVIKASDFYHVPAEKIVKKTKNRPACLARQMVWYICRDHYYMTYQCLADYFSGRNHKTIFKGIRTIKGELDVNKERQEQDRQLRQGL